MKQYSIFDVSEWFLSKESMTPKKLQKLSYYFEAWCHALFNRSLINDTHFEAWVHGPVSPELYNEYKEYGWNDIEQHKKDNSETFEPKALELLQSVWLTYGDKSANELEALTHSEIPWRNARKGLEETEPSNNQISSQDMHEYYLSIYIGD
ncbi:hypothetical protein Javan59_0006 [Streptococcus phage Javan59]|uniref:Panacea domain-containing protein n=1 Tax=Streptococcus anginosus TaxID=1328 RepID=UPI000391AB8C|nr:type II toxin-antitoxin system antitoxin SocA domain-containing protein [Streptococcus anginosus]QBX21735.1 hypothetical protein Javan59_0006 [Streptococcus phage Javan59]GAD41456.1 hypothetical protein ANG4_0050 [Streptococcus anginosus 1505]